MICFAELDTYHDLILIYIYIYIVGLGAHCGFYITLIFESQFQIPKEIKKIIEKESCLFDISLFDFFFGDYYF